MSLYKYKQFNKGFDEFAQVYYQSHDNHLDRRIYKCPDCGRVYQLVRENSGVRNRPHFLSGIFPTDHHRPCGQKDCRYVAEKSARHPCGLLKEIWQTCVEKRCAYKDKCEAYKPGNRQEAGLKPIAQKSS